MYVLTTSLWVYLIIPKSFSQRTPNITLVFVLTTLSAKHNIIVRHSAVIVNPFGVVYLYDISLIS